MSRFMGVDVGALRKRFDVALIGDGELLELAGRLSREDVAALAAKHRPQIIAIDSPRSCAPDGASSRDCERALAKSVCGIRWTPDAARVHASNYYAWIVEGLALYRELTHHRGTVIEVFPTASWTRWHGKRGKQHRSTWSRQALAALNLRGVPGRTNQDQRDAIAAAVTAERHAAGLTEQFGEIVVPRHRR
jgi:predicted nuclease with RNAse H fold